MSNDKQVRVRFAPSPTGKLHIGGARTAIYNWAFARANKGVFILRIDDTDPTRSTEENTQIILRAMRWLGLDWDEGPEVGGNFGPYKQTDRIDNYRKAVEKLAKSGNAYRCFCTQEKLEQDRLEAKERKDSYQGYARTCRNLSEEEIQARIDAGEPYVWRIKVPEDRGDIIVKDAVHGEVTFDAKELDDFVIMRSDGTPTYNFATVVDDAEMKITHIIRGDDHLSNTPRQVVVYEALGAEVPMFAHISMILGEDGKKLSKRHGATSVEEYRDALYDSEAFVNYLSLLGWSLDGETTIIPRGVLASKFNLEHISKNPATFDSKKLNWINSEYMTIMQDEQFSRDYLLPAAVSAGLASEDAYDKNPEWYNLLASMVKTRIKLKDETVRGCIINIIRFLYEGNEVTFDEKSVRKNLEKEGADVPLHLAIEALSSLDTWKADVIDNAIADLPDKAGLNKRKFYQPIRVAVCGNQVSPPLGESMQLLGKDVVIERLKRAIPLCGAKDSDNE